MTYLGEMSRISFLFVKNKYWNRTCMDIQEFIFRLYGFQVCSRSVPWKVFVIVYFLNCRTLYYSLVKQSSPPVDFSVVTNSNEKSFVAINADMVPLLWIVDFQVCGLNHLIVACMKAINREELEKKFISGSLNREIVYSLSPYHPYFIALYLERRTWRKQCVCFPLRFRQSLFCWLV